jgi:hypothetical protein
MATRIQLRRDIAANWTAANPVLANAEPGYETDTGFLKYGDGITPWNSLPYASTGGSGGSGATGPQGVTGIAGLPGIQGITGLRGFTGVQGLQGIQGNTGLLGPAGVTGAGIQGATGLVGADGDDGATGIQGQTGLQGVTGPAGTGGGGGGVTTEYEIRLGASSDIATMINTATAIPSGWLLDDGAGSLGNVTASGLGSTASSDLVIQTGLGSYVVGIQVIQYADSGPATILGFYNQHVDNTSLNWRSNLAGSQFVFYNFLAITTSSRKTYLVIRLANV